MSKEKLSESGKKRLNDALESIKAGRYKTFTNTHDLIAELFGTDGKT